MAGTGVLCGVRLGRDDIPSTRRSCGQRVVVSVRALDTFLHFARMGRLLGRGVQGAAFQRLLETNKEAEIRLAEYERFEVRTYCECHG